MALENFSEAWEAYTGSFPLADYNFVPTGQLLQPSQSWQLDEQEPFQINKDLDVSSGDEDDFEVEVNKEHGGMADDAAEDIEEEDIERVTNPVTLHGLPSVPNDFQPFEGENHPRSWNLPYGFESGARVSPPQRCTDTCSHAGHGENCSSTASDLGVSIEDRWNLLFLIFELFFTKEVMETMVSNTNGYAASKNAGVPAAGHQSRRL